MTRFRLILAALALLGLTQPLMAQSKTVRMTPADIDAATFTGPLPSGQSAITAKVQLLLDRAGISPGVVDGHRGGMSDSALKAFQRREGLPMDGVLTQEVWDLLQPYAADPLIVDYTITAEDLNGLSVEIPRDYKLMAQLDRLGYTSVPERLGERFHMDQDFLVQLNPGAKFVPGEVLKVLAPAKPLKGSVTRIIVDKQTRRVAAYDAKGRLIADYPATVGSDQMPSPSGEHTVRAVAINPTYHYNPRINPQQGDNDQPLTLPPGPNGPVGSVWIGLSKPTYGIHGTPTPSRLFVNHSSGCVRLTNWDAEELAHMVKAGGTTVTFVAPGQTIADIMGTGHSATPRAAVASKSLSTVAAAVPTSPRPPRKPVNLAVPATTVVQPSQPTPPQPTAQTVSQPVTAPTPASTAPTGVQVQTLPAPQVIPELERALQQLDQDARAATVGHRP